MSKVFLLALMVLLCGASECEDTPQSLILQQLGVTKAVIFNSDDLGLTDVVNQGIADTWVGAGGLVASVSLQTASDEATLQDALEWLASNPDVDGGVHLTLSTHVLGLPMRPVLDPALVPSLVDENGFFYSSNTDLFFRMSLGEAEDELRAQIEVALDNGIDITHLDSHLGVCDYPTGLQNIYLNLAREYDVPVRWFWGPYDSRLTNLGIAAPNYAIITETEATVDDLERKRQAIIEKLRNSPEGTITEFFFHPATQMVPNFEWRYLEYLLPNPAEPEPNSLAA